jgi:hypothetical protein
MRPASPKDRVAIWGAIIAAIAALGVPVVTALVSDHGKTQPQSVPGGPDASSDGTSTGPSSGEAGTTSLVFDFERYAPGGLVGQDGWETVAPGEASPQIEGEAGQREASCKAVVSGAERPLPVPADWALEVGNKCIWQMRVCVDGPTLLTAGLTSHGSDPTNPRGRTVAFGVWAPTGPASYPRAVIDAGGELYPGDRIEFGRWYDLRLTLDWNETPTATLSYRLVGGVASAFTIDPSLSDVPVWLVEGMDDSRKFVRFSHVSLKLASSGRAGLDDLSFSLPSQPFTEVLAPTFTREKTVTPLSREQLESVGASDVGPGWLHFDYSTVMAEKILADASIVLSATVEATGPDLGDQRLLGVQLTFSVSQVQIGRGTIGRSVAADGAAPVRMAVTACPSMAKYQAQQVLGLAEPPGKTALSSTTAQSATEKTYFCSFRIEPRDNMTWGMVKSRQDLEIRIEASEQ